MFSSNSPKEKRNKANRIVSFILLGFFVFSIISVPVHIAKAQALTSDVQTVTQTGLEKFWDTLKKLLAKAGSFAFQRTLSSALNKIAYDTASYLGSGGEGQKPLFITADWGTYLGQIGDEAAGEFLETFSNQMTAGIAENRALEGCKTTYSECMEKCQIAVLAPSNNWDEEGPIPISKEEQEKCSKACSSELNTCNKSASSDASASASASKSKKTDSTSASASVSFNSGAISSFNVCQPSSLQAKVKISLGLVEQNRPSAPSCKATDIIKNWSDATNFKNKNFLDDFKDIFDPRGNDLGIYVLARSDMGAQAEAQVSTKKSELETNEGWLDVRDIAGMMKGTPGAAKQSSEDASDAKKSNFGKVTGDILIDAANVFLNQLALSAFNNLMQSLGEKASDINNDSGSSAALTNPNYDVTVVYGESKLQEIISTSLGPNFSTRTDYDILSQLAICPDEKNPGPTDCVIDNKFMQGITEKKTVAEAIKEGYLNGSWQMTVDPTASTYSLRNVSILRQYRILPLGWEVAISKAFADPASPKKVTLNDLVSCFDITDQYTSFSSDFDVRDQGWCQGLVDPNWVLKAPLNYCKKQGFGSQIMSQNIVPKIEGTNGTADTLSSFNLARSEEYCADNQTCIKEKNDGSCEKYGYCDEERRIWNFGSDACEPIYNTCRTFTGPSGQASYLENTLDYGDCDADSAGCRRYSLSGAYATSTGAVSWSAASNLYLNKNTSDCDSGDEGCTEMMRVKPTWGSNLVMDSDFNNEAIGASSTAASKLNDWPYRSSNADDSTRKATIVDASDEPGGAVGKALKLEVMGNASGQVVLGTYSDFEDSLLPVNLQLLPGQAYTVSADVYLVNGRGVSLFIGAAGENYIASTTVKNKWQHLTVTRPAQTSYNSPEFGVNGDSLTGGQVTFYLRNLKFEMSSWDTGGSTYGAFKVYEKLLPPYLEKTCYTDATSATKDYRLKNGAPAVCSNYARKCNQSEVGCELYTSSQDGLSIPAQVQTTDYCPAECVNYDIYISKENYFNSPQAENLIPSRSQACTAEAAGCTEFTNLDALAQGGESKEYYSSFKQCIKPSQGDCGNFYAWEGTDNGYQLKLYALEKDSNDLPKVTSNDSSLCNAQIYNKPVGDPAYNSDCREFYNTAGQVAYHLLSRTITCSDNCHAYRMNGNNPDKTLTQAQCTGMGKHWDNSASVCLTCPNGGAWDTTHNACIYQAIPGEGKKCQAEQKGCREYNGNSGSNVRLAAYYDFEGGASGWYSNCIGGVAVSTISNNKNGHSLAYSNSSVSCQDIGEEEESAPVTRSHRLIEKILAATDAAAQLKLGQSVSQGLAYNVKFIARAANAANLQIYFYNKDTDQKAYFNAGSALTVAGGNEWAVYQANLASLDHEVGANEILVITADKPFYFDDFILTEITDRYYLISGSSDIPPVCYYDAFDNYQGADFNLGCSAYFDRDNLEHDLHRFSRLCSDSSVGCEQMIDTKNYSPYGPGIWNDTNNNGQCDPEETDCVRVDGDSASYAIYDVGKQCNVTDLGCSRLGQAKGSGTSLTWTDVYKKNNPNGYGQNLCGLASVGCEAWVGDDNETSYFKDPGSNVCAYRQSQDSTVATKGWYKIPAKRCDTDGNGKIDGTEKGSAVCTTDSDCNNKACLLDTNDYACSTSYLKTFGLGGGGNQIPTPDTSAGSCEAASSGCTEYLDPVSRFAANLVYNPSYQLSGSSYEGWGGSYGQKWNNSSLDANQQVVKLEPNKIYIFRTISEGNNSGDVRLDFLSSVKPLLGDNTLGTSTNFILIPNNGANRHFLFYSLNNSKALLTGGQSGKTIEVKAAVINYQLQSNVDKKSCNGQVKFDNGCVLFNERSVSGSAGLASLAGGWDPYDTTDGQSPVVCDAGEIDSCQANQLVKVRPDRVCAKWLDCLTYVQDSETNSRVCYAVGECDRLDDKGDCTSFSDVSTTSARTFDAGRDKNATGYSLVDKYYLDQMKEVGLNSEAHYDFEDSLPVLSCQTASGGACIFNKNIVADSLIREPEGAPTDYPAHGKSYLKVPAKYRISPQSANAGVSLLSDKDYYINYLVNTKNSGVGAKIEISSSVGTIATFTDTGSSGWERKIHKFHSPSSGASIHIYLGSDDPKKDGFVYFDDINIEPVLEVAPSQYVARECRLYPTTDSLTCNNKNNNVIADGLEGYCLQHDSSNPNVCLLWYPVDRISSAHSGQQSLGYQGKYPLNYCTEVNGSFDLVEKRVALRVYHDSNEEGNELTCYYAKATDKDLATPDGEYCSKNKNVFNNGNVDMFVKDGLEGAQAVQKRCQSEKSLSDDFDYFLVRFRGWGADSMYCMPLNKNLIMQVGQSNFVIKNTDFDTQVPVYYSGWFRYNSFSKNNSPKSQDEPCDSGPCEYSFNEVKNSNRPIRVYDYSHVPADEDGLKLIDSSDPDEAYRLTCNSFIQTVDSSGLNLSWAVRTSINTDYPTSTPPYFVKNNKFYGQAPYNIIRYGRNREDIPFGAAAWPDSYDLLGSEPVKLRDQYSKKNNEEIFAGRPFGCLGGGCANIGYCSLDPSVYCFISEATPSSSYDLSLKSCAGGSYGYCQPLWSAASPLTGNDYEDILKTLFLRSYNSYSYSTESNSYVSVSSAYDYSNIEGCEDGIRPIARYGNITNSTNSFCAIYPQIRNVTLKFNGQAVEGNNPFNIKQRGVYRLEFNTEVDSEQQPLREIRIDWGDGEPIQVITGQDHRPATSTPHVFYHFYRKANPEVNILMTIYDNWGKYGSCMIMAGDKNPPNHCPLPIE